MQISSLPGHFVRVLESRVAGSAHPLLLGPLARHGGPLLEAAAAEGEPALGACVLTIEQREILHASVARHFFFIGDPLEKRGVC